MSETVGVHCALFSSHRFTKCHRLTVRHALHLLHTVSCASKKHSPVLHTTSVFSETLGHSRSGHLPHAALSVPLHLRCTGTNVTLALIFFASAPLHLHDTPSVYRVKVYRASAKVHVHRAHARCMPYGVYASGLFYFPAACMASALEADAFFRLCLKGASL